MMVKERNHSLDIAKGLLILLVVFHHLPSTPMGLGIDDPVLENINTSYCFYTSFFMPAFFIITGMCSNFDIPFKKFLIKNVRNILVPAYFFDWLCNIAVLLNYHNFSMLFWTSFFKEHGAIMLEGSCFWFLNALFVSKILFWCIYKLPRKFQLVCVLILMGVGCLCNEYIKIEIWSTWHAFALTFFLWFGTWVKNKKLSKTQLIYTFMVYIMCLIVAAFVQRPYITSVFLLNIKDIPYYILLALSGSVTFIFGCKSVKPKKLIEYLGRNSLIIYCVHIHIMKIVHTHVYMWYNVNVLQSVVLLLFIFIVTMLTCVAISYIMNQSKLNWILHTTV